jgi:glycosyltransferase involved in cell wall biosynthesis
LGNARVHLNWNLPDLSEFDATVVNTLMSLTAQRLMRGPLRHQRWIFFGERLGMGSRWWHRALSAPLHRASAIAAIGSWAQGDYRRRFPEPRSYCLPYACELERFLAQPRHPCTDEVVFLFCGQMIARKGVDLLLNAFARLQKGRLLLVGREAELPSLIAILPADVVSRVEYLGFRAPEELSELFSRADVFVLPSRYDGWGVVVNQATASALPVICSDQVGAGHDLVVEGENGLTFRAGDEEDLHRAMKWFIENPGAIESMGTASRRIAEKWVPARIAERWVDAINEVLSS